MTTAGRTRRLPEFYGLTPPYVGLLKKLLTLPTATQKLVHSRQLSVKATAALTELTPEQQQQAIEPGQSRLILSPMPHR